MLSMRTRVVHSEPIAAGGDRPMGTALLLAVVDQNNGPQLYMVEPSGTGLVRTHPAVFSSRYHPGKFAQR